MYFLKWGQFFVPLVLVFCLQNLSQVTAIRCFQCNSLNDTDCATVTQKDMDHPLLKDCPEYYQNFWNDERHEMFCRSVVQTIKIRDNMVRVTRSCGWVKYHKPCYKVTSEVKNELVCQCFEDGCNASKSSTLLPKFALVIFSVLFLGKMFSF